MGDFVKGNPAGLYSDVLVQGIRLHRFVDSFTDQHALVIALKSNFPPALRRFAPIALDMFWDHCLAKHWNEFESGTLQSFCLNAEKQISNEITQEQALLPERFLHVSGLVWKQRWLESYQSLENTQHAIKRIATRSPRLSALASTGLVLEENYQLFSEQFWQFYPQVVAASKSHIQR